jgi:hypothetical protein
MFAFAPEKVAGAPLSFVLLAGGIAAVMGCSQPSEAPSAVREPLDEVAEVSDKDDGSSGARQLEVHEWGTFTSMNGAGGVSLDGLHHEEEELPAFVHSNTGRAYVSPFQAYGDTSADRPIRRVRSKMETPVIYFYPKNKMRVSVRVGYEGGLITQWFPAASKATPAISATPLSPLDIGRVERSSFEWELELTPAGASGAPSIPEVAAHHAWQFAREVRAAYVTAPGNGAGGKAESERYVFYRGLGKVQPSVRALPLGGGHVATENMAGAPISAAFALEMKETTGRFMAVGALAGGVSKVVRFEGPERAKEAVVEALSKEMLAALVGEGLFEDEARAMVKTWAPTWFASEGTRVLSIVPRQVTDAVLPLTITPAPDRLVRVLVARTELLTAETEAAVEKALLERTWAEASVRDAAMRRLARVGRFLEPAVRSVVAKTNDAAVKKSGAEVLASFR